MIGKTINHYLILEKVGEGGMGIVYRARDLRLEREVALKFLSLDFTGSEELKQRFILEAQSASVLDHPNICTIHAIEETEDGRLFIVMGYYAGQTIKAKLREGPLSWQEVTDLAVQITSGLGAAHERGLIHMDVKPANLLVTPDGTLKILDFGLSRFTSEIDRTRPRGPLMGTVAYMSPEQVQNEKTGPESDIWALGVVLYELITGKRPFRGKNDMAVLYSIVHKDVEPPIKRQPNIPTELDKIIRRMLVKDRNYRYQETEELLADLDPLQQSSQTVTDPLPWVTRQDWQRQKVFQRLLGGIALVAVMLLIGFYFLIPNSEQSSPTAVRVLLFDLERLEPEAEGNEWMGVVLSELLTIELPASRDFQWIREGDRVSAEETPLPIDTWDFFDLKKGLPASTLTELRELQVAWVVGGSFAIVDGMDVEPGNDGPAQTPHLKFRLAIQSTEPNRLVKSLDVDEPAENLHVVRRLAEFLAPILSVDPRPLPPRDGLPTQPKARRLLTSAMNDWRLFELLKAREQLKQAKELESGNALIQAQLAATLGRLGHEGKARVEALNAVAASKQLSPIQQLYVRALKCEVERRKDKAAAFLHWIWTFHGGLAEEIGAIDRFNLTLRLARLLTQLEQSDSALEILNVLKVEWPDHPHIVISEGMAAAFHPDKQKLYARAADLALKQDARLLAGQAWLLEGQAWQWLGVKDQAEEKLKAARDIFDEEGHVGGEANSYMALGSLQWHSRRELVSAKGSYETAARLFGRIGNRRGQGACLTNQALVLSSRGDFGAAIGLNQEADAIYQQAGVRDLRGLNLFNMAESMFANGEINSAEEAYEKSLDLSTGLELATGRSLYGKFLTARGSLPEARHQLDLALTAQLAAGEVIDSARTKVYLGKLLFHQGDLPTALEMYWEALEIFNEKEIELAHAETLAEIGEIFMWQGKLATAAKNFADALQILDLQIDPHPAARVRLALARVRIEEDKPEEAVRLAGEVLTDLTLSRAVFDKGDAHVILARGLLAQADDLAAKKEVDKARDLTGMTDSPLFKLSLEIAAARISISQRELNEAYSRLQEMLPVAAKGGFEVLELEIGLALGEVDAQNGSHRAALPRFRQIEDAAASKGLHLLEQKAARYLAAMETQATVNNQERIRP